MRYNKKSLVELVSKSQQILVYRLAVWTLMQNAKIFQYYLRLVVGVCGWLLSTKKTDCTPIQLGILTYLLSEFLNRNCFALTVHQNEKNVLLSTLYLTVPNTNINWLQTLMFLSSYFQWLISRTVANFTYITLHRMTLPMHHAKL